MLPPQALSSVLPFGKNVHYPAIMHERFARRSIGLMADRCPKRLDDRPYFLAKYNWSIANPMVGTFIRLPHQRQSSFGAQGGCAARSALVRAKRSPPSALIIKKGLLPNHPFSHESLIFFSYPSVFISITLCFKNYQSIPDKITNIFHVRPKAFVR